MTEKQDIVEWLKEELNYNMKLSDEAANAEDFDGSFEYATKMYYLGVAIMTIMAYRKNYPDAEPLVSEDGVPKFS